jgi:hypothetical protein
MVTVVKRPQGHKIIDQAIASTIIDSSGDALISEPYHALTTGAIVYIESDIDEYNGFWYVTVIDYQTFKISEHSQADFVEFYQEAEIDYYQTNEHDWSSVFLPIVYKAENDKWPTNSLDTAQTVSSFSDDNGFTQLTLSGSLRGSVKALEFVKISGASDEELNDIWQIVEVTSTSNVVINLPYDSSLSFAGATVQYYYNNYQVKIKIYSGLAASHPWNAKKPYEEVAELSLTPDENNEVMFSVAEYIRTKVAIKNNTTIFSYPLNLDAFTGFYISVAETFDQSDNYTLYTTDAVYQNDAFNGYAIAGKLPFKNMYSGDYADYVYTSGSPALWLTLMERPIAVENHFFDISFIKNIVGTFNLIIDKYVSDYLTQTIVIPYSDQGIGVYRMPITADANYDSFCIRVVTDAHQEEQETTETEDFDLSLWTNHAGGLTDWTTGIAAPFVNIVGANSNFLLFPYATNSGQIYTYQYRFSVVNSDPGTKTAQLLFLDAAFLAIGFTFIDVPGDGTYAGSVNITPSANGTYIAFKVSSIGLAWDVTLELVSATTTTTETVEVPGATITEEICIDILESCDVENEVVQDEDRRLLEDGDYRLLE